MDNNTIQNNKIQLIGLDLDDTTLTSDKKLTPHTKRVLEECIRRGIQVIPTTGRVRSGIPDYIRSIEGIRYIITSNGGSVVDMKEDKIIYENGIDWQRALDIFDYLEGFHTFYDCYTMGNGWCEGRFYDHIEDYGIYSHMADLIHITRTRIDDLRAFIKEHKRPVEKINMFFAKPEQRDQVLAIINDIPDLAGTYSLPNNLEINDISCNKGNALLGLGKLLSIPRENIMACGDGTNDLEMIKQAGVGVAMSNALPVVLEHADFITKSNNEEGVAYAIQHFCHFTVD